MAHYHNCLLQRIELELIHIPKDDDDDDDDDKCQVLLWLKVSAVHSIESRPISHMTLSLKDTRENLFGEIRPW